VILDHESAHPILSKLKANQECFEREIARIEVCIDSVSQKYLAITSIVIDALFTETLGDFS